MYGNLLRECGVLRSISETAQTALSHIVTIFLGITVAFQMRAESFVRWDTLLVLAEICLNSELKSQKYEKYSSL